MDKLTDTLSDFFNYIMDLTLGIIAWVAIAYAGVLLFKNMPGPWDLILGLPVSLLGVGLTINNAVSITLRFLGDRRHKKSKY